MNSKSPFPLLEIKELQTHFFLRDQVLKAVDGVSYHVNEGETLAIVGESGSGKSVGAFSILRLFDASVGKIVGGSIKFRGRELTRLSDKEIRSICGKKISMIFQEPMSSLNPVLTVGDQISETVRKHQGVSRSVAKSRAIEILRKVGVPAPEERVNDYPHQFSGGMRQRVMIAIALSCDPDLLIADEPTTALDVTIQAQIMELIDEVKRELGTSVILITHDLALVSERADRVVVMYAGKVMECAKTNDIFQSAKHPYTQALLNSLPSRDFSEEKSQITEIEILRKPPEVNLGCTFYSRCPHAKKKCTEKFPDRANYSESHYVYCWHANAEDAV
jgi:peptide/nickel transport system ATP-binding protein